LTTAFLDGRDEPATITPEPTVAEGIAIARPARGAQILAAVRDTGGAITSVTDEQVQAAHAALARAGLYVEPTGAACWAALSAGLVGEPAAPADTAVPFAVAPLCGSGLKSKPPTTPN